MSHSSTLFIGMEVHKATIAVASVAQDHGAELTYLGTIGTRQCDSDQRVRKRPSKATHLVFVYEAGPCGDWLDRDLSKNGSDGWVVAPSLIPNKAGERVTTDRRDAGPRARLARSGDLTAVDVPTVADDASRDLRRAREDPLSALTAAKFRLNAFFLRHDSRDTGRATWSQAPRRGRSEGVGPTPAPQIVLQAYGRAVNEHTERLHRLEQALQEQVTSWRLYPVGGALQALRGVQFTVAVTTVAERGDLTRFATPRALMKCLGLIPSESSSGERRRQGALTNAGNTHARRALVEGAGAYRSPAKVSRHLQRRLEKPPKVIQDLSWKAQGRLCKRSRNLLTRGKPANQVVVAIARE